MAMPDGEKAQKRDGRLLRGDATRERVLNAAERLFAEHGFDAVSIRQIAEAAGVTLGVVAFHGGSKDNLFHTILKRRVDILSQARRRALAQLRADTARKPELWALMSAYVGPHLQLVSSGDPQWRAYATLCARIVHDERWYGLLHELYDKDARDYVAAIHEILPGADLEQLAAAFAMSVAAMLSIVISTHRARQLMTDDTAAPAAVPSLTTYAETLVAFCVGGIERAALAPKMRTRGRRRSGA